MTSDGLDRAFAEHGDRWLGPLCGTWPDAGDADWEAVLAEAGSRLAAVLDQPAGASYRDVAEGLATAATAARGLPVADPATTARTKGGILVRLERAEQLADELRQQTITRAAHADGITAGREPELTRPEAQR
ncbi:hypothetical protein ABT095_14705 [Kitasatospora sp. NPDC002227]|uniref:hypothetical protein n=1 Tax=Kitasatospora sp. NPDC002227 TaxID=3154773 RepID=UPI00331CB5D5